LAKGLGIDENDVIVASTGVIGLPLDVDKIIAAVPALVENLEDTSENAATSIMTTDLKQKIFSVSFEIDGKTATIGAIGKGSGMIHPNMATMLGFLTTDLSISSEMLSKALKASVEETFNMVSVDGDTSTNDMVSILANGLCGNKEITSECENYKIFLAALTEINKALSRAIARDGEGATKLITCTVKASASKASAVSLAKTIIASSLVKTAVFGADANWGRILCAIGYAEDVEDIDVNKIDIYFKSSAGEILVCENGAGIAFDEDLAKKILLKDEIEIIVDLKAGDEEATAWGCDLSYDYVRINGDYRS
ncbi:MAG: bifunctional glutamate N-acetyltransferase/amino-acid acetyltransferase ArgJ, partial [Candidatus Izemoplasmatales bacterium]|nr:bifunctional glutamate N-acetyltransferase/amino-acid acetyltransferase ArgJ [Candidatus Izemoplasmatales bacterium]